MSVKVTLQASRRLSEESEDSKRYEFSFEMAGEMPKKIADCLHAHRDSTMSVDGYVYRPCPVREKTGAPRFMCSNPLECTWQGEPDNVGSERVCPRCGRWATWAPAKDRFQRVDLEICLSCEWAGRPILGLEEDRGRVLEAFQLQLAQEDFTPFPELRDEDRSAARWVVFWGQLQVEAAQ